MKNILHIIVLSFLFSVSQSALAAQCIGTEIGYSVIIFLKYSSDNVVMDSNWFASSKGQCVATRTSWGWKCSKVRFEVKI